MGVGDDGGQFLQRAVHGAQKDPQLDALTVGADLFEIGRIQSAQPGADLVDESLRALVARGTRKRSQVRADPLELVDQRPRILGVEEQQVGHRSRSELPGGAPPVDDR